MALRGRRRTNEINVRLLADKLAKLAEQNPKAKIYVDGKAVIDVREENKTLILTFE